MTLTVTGARGLVTEGWDKEAFHHQLPCIFCILNYVKNKIGEIKTKRFFYQNFIKKQKTIELESCTHFWGGHLSAHLFDSFLLSPSSASHSLQTSLRPIGSETEDNTKGKACPW